MKATKNIARLAVTAGLTAALSFGGVMAPVTMAFAAEGTAATANTITINKNENNGDVKYKAYQIFEADVVDERLARLTRSFRMLSGQLALMTRRKKPLLRPSTTIIKMKQTI